MREWVAVVTLSVCVSLFYFGEGNIFRFDTYQRKSLKKEEKNKENSIWLKYGSKKWTLIIMIKQKIKFLHTAFLYLTGLRSSNITKSWFDIAKDAFLYSEWEQVQYKKTLEAQI